MTPEEELKRLNRLIRQFESVYKTTSDSLQKDRVNRELKKLKTRKEQIESFHELDLTEVEEEARSDDTAGMTYLKEILARESRKEGRPPSPATRVPDDRELRNLGLYLSFFEHEFLPLLSETRLKLDFKHSLERDGFYHRFGNLRRLFADLGDEEERMDPYFVEKHAEDFRQRSFKKKRNFVVEADRFFRSLIHFTGGVVEDVRQAGSICLNHGDNLHFDRRIEGPRYLDGVRVSEALDRLYGFSREVVSYLNVPQIEAQDG